MKYCIFVLFFVFSGMSFSKVNPQQEASSLSVSPVVAVPEIRTLNFAEREKIAGYLNPSISSPNYITNLPFAGDIGGSSLPGIPPINPPHITSVSLYSDTRFVPKLSSPRERGWDFGN